MDIIKRRTDALPYIAAHRGVSSANIPCNTIAAYGIALMQGADIVEIDISRSRDGGLYVFHPGMEPAHLGSKKFISEMESKEVEELRYLNQDNVPTSYKVSTLDEVLVFLKDRCYINVDKYWMWIEEITGAIRRHGMEKQVITKIPAEEKYFAAIEKHASDIPFMVMVEKKDNISEMLLSRNLTYLGAEVLFASEEDEVVSDTYFKKMHDNGLLIWGNPIVYNEKANIAAGHTDDAALTVSMDYGWGWYCDKGFDIIQTDWCLMLKNYLLSR